MKKILLFSLFLSLSCGTFAQSEKASEMLKSIEGKYTIDDNRNITFKRVVQLIDTITGDTLSKDEIYNRAYSYFVYNYVSGEDVIQLSDKINGVIVAKGIYLKVHSDVTMVLRNVDVYHILRIDIKNGKARIILSLSEYKLTVSDGKGLPSISNFNISDTYPLNEKAFSKTFYSKAFVKTYEEAMATLDELEKAIRDGNTSKSIENNSW